MSLFNNMRDVMNYNILHLHKKKKNVFLHTYVRKRIKYSRIIKNVKIHDSY